ncbi:MAG: MarR family transcriptional regulator [Anaerofustis sp.]
MDTSRENEKYLIFLKLMHELEHSFQFIENYNSVPQIYNGMLFYNAETHTLQAIGQNHGMTISELAVYQDKTKSACSQMVKNLIAKGLVMQAMKPTNKKERYLYLTEKGMQIYNSHEAFDHKCFMKAYDKLMPITAEEMEIYISIQQKLNQSFAEDLSVNIEKYETYMVQKKEEIFS